jgi:hypothetical protein
MSNLDRQMTFTETRNLAIGRQYLPVSVNDSLEESTTTLKLVGLLCIELIRIMIILSKKNLVLFH